jgi:PAS domain S-box-containing protein
MKIKIAKKNTYFMQMAVRVMLILSFISMYLFKFSSDIVYWAIAGTFLVDTIQCFVSAVVSRINNSNSDSLKKYRVVLNNTIFGVYAINCSGDIIFANEAMINHLGYSKEELLKMNIVDIVSQNCKDYILDDVKSKCLGESTQTRYKCTIVTKSGVEIPVEKEESVVINGTKNIIGIIDFKNR